MSVFREILFVFVVSIPAAVDGQFLSLVVRNGDNVTLPCRNVANQSPPRCPGPVWTFNQSISRYKMVFNITESFRLNIKANCSLVITEVTSADAGVYTCQAQSTEQIHLTVIGLVECRSERFVTLECLVTGPVQQAAQWQDVPNTQGIEQTMDLQLATVSFSAFHQIYASKVYESWSCHVTDTVSGVERVFGLPPKPLVEEQASPGFSSVDWVMLVMHMAELILITVIIILLFKARGYQKTAGGTMACEYKDGREATVKYENVGNASA